MARRKKGGSSLGTVIVVAACVMLAKVIVDYWPFFLFLLIAYVVYRIFLSSPGSPEQLTTERPVSIPAPTRNTTSRKRDAPKLNDRDDLESFVTVSAPSSSPTFSIPGAPVDVNEAHWLKSSESFSVGGLNIDGGFLYVGTALKGANGGFEPALINTKKTIDTNAGYSERRTNYWPSYSGISPEARGAYLKWLSDGRDSPNADIGYVFLYFYGLERRILVDLVNNKDEKNELTSLINELKRLFSIYAEKSGSFKSYCGNLIEFSEISNDSEKGYEENYDSSAGTVGFPFLLRLAIGKAVRDGNPISSELALAWVERDPAIVRRVTVTRCAAEFKKLFASLYVATYGAGLKIAPNKAKLKMHYQPASPGFSGAPSVKSSFGEVPDVTALTGPVNKLQTIVDSCVKTLEPYSRYLAKNPNGHTDLEAILTLPIQLWPEATKESLVAIKDKIANSIGPLTLTFKELLTQLNASENLNKGKLQVLADAFEIEGVGLEPDVLEITRVPKPDEPVVLFLSSNAAADIRNDPVYKVAKISVELAAAIAHVDGNFSLNELNHLNNCIDRWGHLNSGARERLKAYARLLMISSVSLTSIKKKVESFDKQTCEKIGAFAATMVVVDGAAGAQEIKLLEKIYLQLGIERKNAYSDIHTVYAAEPAQHKQTSTTTSPVFTLDASKIAALKYSSDQISARLSEIFSIEPEPQVTEQLISSETDSVNSILNLDTAHSAFARALIARPTWQRSELLDLAGDLKIMLDGALERLNEASLDELDLTFTEGDDPVDINAELVERLTQ